MIGFLLEILDVFDEVDDRLGMSLLLHDAIIIIFFLFYFNASQYKNIK